MGFPARRIRWKELTPRRWSISTFGATILLSAFLLFQVQPLVSKAILPWFGGCPAVWTTCMLFFQVVLFAGMCTPTCCNNGFRCIVKSPSLGW